MNKHFLTLAAAAALVMGCSTRAEAAVSTVMTLDGGGGITASIDDTGGCAGAGCAALNIIVNGAHGTIIASTKTKGGFNGFTIQATGIGGDDSTLPTLMNLNQINAERTGTTGGTLTTTFFDSFYPTVNNILDIADSVVIDQQISTSTVQFTVFTGPGAGPATDQIEQNSLTGASANGHFIVPNATNTPTASIRTQTVMTFTNQGAIQANITVANVLVPEPASIVFMGTTILGVTALIRRRQKRA